MQNTAKQCPFVAGAAKNPAPRPDEAKKTYVAHCIKGMPILGLLPQIARGPLQTLGDNASRYGDIIAFHVIGQKFIQLNHPDLIRYVLMENHKNYKKSSFYMRFESALGLGLLTSDGTKWKRDRQTIQPMFRREQIEGAYFAIINEVSEKFKRRWLALTENGPAEINVIDDMAAITLEVILQSIFGKDDLDDATVTSIHDCYAVLIDYLNHERIFPKIDLEGWFHTPRYHRFKKELERLRGICTRLLEQYKKRNASDPYNMLALLLEAQKQDPQQYTDQEILDQLLTMIFGGFETTAVTMQWMWYILDTRPDITEKLRADIAQHAPCASTDDSAGLTYEAVNKMHYLTAVFQEAIRLYPPFWATSRQAIGEDFFGDFKVNTGTLLVLPHIIVQRDPRFWPEPNAFIPERFLTNEKIDQGLYFPFSHGPRKCVGFKFTEIEVKAVFAKLLPLFKVTALNVIGNEYDSIGITYKLRQPLRAVIQRR